MKTKTIKTSELEGPALDWAVAAATGVEINISVNHTVWIYEDEAWPGADPGFMPWRPSADWSQGGPLIDKYWMLVDVFDDGTAEAKAVIPEGDQMGRHWSGWAKPALVSICQAVVGVHFGDTVDVPEELVGVGNA